VLGLPGRGSGQYEGMGWVKVALTTMWRLTLVALTTLLVGCIDGSLGGSDDDGSEPGFGMGGGGSGGSGGDAGPGPGAGGGEPAPQPEQVTPCENGACWDTSAYVAECSSASIDEDFSSGNYNVHRYASQLWVDTTTTITVDGLSGAWEPAIIVALADGEVVFDGVIGATTETMTVEWIDTGSSSAEIEITSADTLEVDVFVTSHQVIDSDFVDAIPQDASYRLDIESDCSMRPTDVLAPAGAIAGEIAGAQGDNAITLGGGSWGPALRFDVPAHTHVGFELGFTPGSADVDMQVLMWTGSEVQEMAVTNGGNGERVLAVLDASANRTYWVRAQGSVSNATLYAGYTAFEEGAQCYSDCDRLLQLPLANDPAVDGYDSADYVVYRYQYGRRDALMSLRHSGRVVANAGVQPFTVQDLSKGDGSQPPGHASHTDGKDVDLSVYDAQGNAVWYPLCDEVANECIPGTDAGFHGEAMARQIAPMLESGRVTHIFLDAEFHASLFGAAQSLVDDGRMAAAMLPTMQDVVQHWPNHNNHIHVRYDTAAY
jgi:hypothetical protein